jgi:hypothetical protein
VGQKIEGNQGFKRGVEKTVGEGCGVVEEVEFVGSEGDGVSRGIRR